VNAGIEASLRFRLRDGLSPGRGRQREHASLRPVGNEAEQVAQVAPELDALQLATRSSDTTAALTSPASSLPMKSQFLRPTASRRNACSE
jgi:hypothetical protein